MTLSRDWYAHPTAVVDEPANIGCGTRIWHFSHVCANAVIGQGCSLGQNVFVASGVRIGKNVKIQNHVSVYQGTILEDDVFLGPSCVLTNVSNPRSQVSRREVFEATLLERGVTVGANATIICGVKLGRYVFVAAGAVVTKSAPQYAFLIGVPARPSGWISRHGHRLRLAEGGFARCPESGFSYELRDGIVRCLDLDEEAPLTGARSLGERSYRDFPPPEGRT